jgi:hypothetical protein
MKTTMLLAALALGTTSAYACDWQKQANSTPVTVATEQATNKPDTQQEPATVSSEAPAPSLTDGKPVQAAQN